MNFELSDTLDAANLLFGDQTEHEEIQVWTPEFAEGIPVKAPHKTDTDGSGLFIGIDANNNHIGRTLQARSIAVSLLEVGYVNRLFSLSECNEAISDFMKKAGDVYIETSVLSTQRDHGELQMYNLGYGSILLIDAPLKAEEEHGLKVGVINALAKGAIVIQVAFNSRNNEFLSTPDVHIRLTKEPSTPGTEKTHTRRIELPGHVTLVREKAPIRPSNI